MTRGQKAVETRKLGKMWRNLDKEMRKITNSDNDNSDPQKLRTHNNRTCENRNLLLTDWIFRRSAQNRQIRCPHIVNCTNIPKSKMRHACRKIVHNSHAITTSWQGKENHSLAGWRGNETSIVEEISSFSSIDPEKIECQYFGLRVDGIANCRKLWRKSDQLTPCSIRKKDQRVVAAIL